MPVRLVHLHNEDDVGVGDPLGQDWEADGCVGL